MSEIRVDKISEKTADAGITLKSQGTADNKPMVLTLQTAETDMAANDVIGKIAFQAPDEGTGTDAILVAAAIQARSEGDFSSSANATAIDFMVGASEAAATKMSLSSGGVLTAVELDISGNIDVDGTTNLDVVDIDGAVNMATTALVTGVLTTTAATVFNGGFTANDGSTITTADNTDTLSLISTDADATSGPNLRLFRNSSSPADSDDIGKIIFSAENDASEEIDYITVRGDLTDVTDGTEDGVLKIAGLIGGAVKEFARFGDGVGVVFNEESNAENDFRVESRLRTHALVIDADTNTTMIGTNETDFNAGADDLIIGTGSGDKGITIYTGSSAGDKGSIFFADGTGATDVAARRGQISYEHNNELMTFFTNDTEAMRIHLNQVISVPAGIALGVATANTASNVLDDYEEGVTGDLTLTPASSGSIAVASGFRQLAYTKVGRVVHITGLLKMGSGDAAGQVTFPLPFALADTSDRAEITRGFGYLVNARAANSAGGICFIDIQTAGATTAIIVKGTNTANGGKDFNATDIDGSGTELSVNFHYLAA
tara:strand:+ start:167 stop:1807 length:1641 start_codon:yes stop_codon:yes gene_type:complete